MCDMSSPVSSSFDSLFEEDWKSVGGQDLGLDSIAGFDEDFNDHGGIGRSDQAGVGSGINPQALNKAPSTAVTHASLHNDSVSAFLNGLPRGDMIDFYAPLAANSPSQTAGVPLYFQKPVEQLGPFTMQQQLYSSSPLQNQLRRRSVSEPPGQNRLPGHLHPHHPSANPTFTRSGTLLGTPKASVMTTSRSSARSKQPIYRQPYSVAKRQAPRQERCGIRRTQTQPVHSVPGPTSAPFMDIDPSLSSHVGITPPVVSTRACTPYVTQKPTTSPGALDQYSILPSSGPNIWPAQDRIAIPITVEELKMMIVDAVREAVGVAIGSSGSAAPPQSIVDAGADPEKKQPGIDELDDPVDCMAGEDVRTSIEDENSLFRPN